MFSYFNLSRLKWLEDTQFINPKNQKRVRCEAGMGTRQHCYRKEAARAVICHRYAGEHVAKLFRSFKMTFFFGGYMRTRRIFSLHVAEWNCSENTFSPSNESSLIIWTSQWVKMVLCSAERQILSCQIIRVNTFESWGIVQRNIYNRWFPP